MGYVKIFLVFEKPHHISQLIEPLFANRFFTPSSLGGLNISRNGRDWLLGGISLEWCLRKYLINPSGKPINRFVFASQPDRAEFGYLQGLSSQIELNQRLNWHLSPYEKADHSLQVTSLSGQHLEKSVLKQLDEWREQFPRSVIRIGGSVHFSTERSIYQELVDQQSFDHWLSQPILEFTIEPSSPIKEDANQVAISIHSEFYVWLNSYAAPLTTQPDIPDADARLNQLSQLTNMIVASGQFADTPEIWLEGHAFRDEMDRFSKAFSSFSPYVEVR